MPVDVPLHEKSLYFGAFFHLIDCGDFFLIPVAYILYFFLKYFF